MTTKDTKLIQARISKDKAIALKQKLVGEGKTIQDFISEQVDQYLAGNPGGKEC